MTNLDKLIQCARWGAEYYTSPRHRADAGSYGGPLAQRAFWLGYKRRSASSHPDLIGIGMIVLRQWRRDRKRAARKGRAA